MPNFTASINEVINSITAQQYALPKRFSKRLGLPIPIKMGAAWATLVCYFAMAMAVVSYLLGRHFYPVTYDVKRILLYVLFGLSLFLAKPLLLTYIVWQLWLLSVALLTLFLLTAVLLEKQKCS